MDEGRAWELEHEHPELMSNGRNGSRSLSLQSWAGEWGQENFSYLLWKLFLRDQVYRGLQTKFYLSLKMLTGNPAPNSKDVFHCKASEWINSQLLRSQICNR